MSLRALADPDRRFGEVQVPARCWTAATVAADVAPLAA